MAPISTTAMGKVTATITLTNHIDQILAERGFISVDEIRSVTLSNVLVDTGASRLCLPANVIQQLGLPLQGEVDAQTAVGINKVRIFKELDLVVEGRDGTFNCIELPNGQDPSLGLIPLEDLGLEPDLTNQRLRLLPTEGKNTYVMVM